MLSVVEDNIFESLPVFLRYVDSFLKEIGQPALPVDSKLLLFSSWAGGDRDGNPFVTADVTLEVALSSRVIACNLYLQKLDQLISELPLKSCPQSLLDYLNKFEIDFSDESLKQPSLRFKLYAFEVPKNEVYRQLFSYVRRRLVATRDHWDAQLHGAEASAQNKRLMYKTTEEFLEPLTTAYNCLLEQNDRVIADGQLLDLIRLVVVLR